jgi:DNA repair protein RadC
MQQLTFWKVEQPPPKVEYRPKVRDLPTRERPVNRLRHVGPMAVSTTELLACLLQTGDGLHQAQELLARFEGLPGLARACETEITQVTGIGPAQAARIQAALEFGRRLLLAKPEDRYQIRSPADAAQMLMAEMAYLEQEHFRVIYLDTRNRMLGVELPVKDLLPGAKVEPPVGDRHDDLAAHNLPLEMGIPVVLAGAVVAVAADRLVGGQSLQPLLIVGV